MQAITLRSSYEAARLARDLKKDLGCLRKHGVDPARFLGGTLAHIVQRIESAVTV